jgi:hypothetical protein
MKLSWVASAPTLRIKVFFAAQIPLSLFFLQRALFRQCSPSYAQQTPAFCRVSDVSLLMMAAISRRGEEWIFPLRCHKSRPSISLLLGQRQRRRTFYQLLEFCDHAVDFLAGSQHASCLSRPTGVVTMTVPIPDWDLNSGARILAALLIAPQGAMAQGRHQTHADLCRQNHG